MPAITIRHHVTNKTDSQNAGALISKKTSTNARLADTTCSATEMPPRAGRSNGSLSCASTTGGVPLLVEKRTGADSHRRILRGGGDSLVHHLLLEL